jgi:hypothetical protein
VKNPIRKLLESLGEMLDDLTRPAPEPIPIRVRPPRQPSGQPPRR